MSDEMLTSAQMQTDTAGKQGQVAAASVVRIICTSTGFGGTGFIHKSGLIITANHVTEACSQSDLVVITSSGNSHKVDNVVAGKDYDVALLKPHDSIKAPTLQISGRQQLPIGMQVTTWGYPAGYSGRIPLLTVGFLSGIQEFAQTGGTTSKRYVVNAAFNGGNSGGPLLDIEDGSVIGVVVSKFAPLPEDVRSALDALQTQNSGLMYTATRPDGSQFQVSEGQVIAQVLQYLRNQTQLVIGYAVMSEDLKAFLKKNKIEP